METFTRTFIIPPKVVTFTLADIDKSIKALDAKLENAKKYYETKVEEVKVAMAEVKINQEIAMKKPAEEKSL